MENKVLRCKLRKFGHHYTVRTARARDVHAVLRIRIIYSLTLVSGWVFLPNSSIKTQVINCHWELTRWKRSWRGEETTSTLQELLNDSVRRDCPFRMEGCTAVVTLETVTQRLHCAFNSKAPRTSDFSSGGPINGDTTAWRTCSRSSRRPKGSLGHFQFSFIRGLAEN